MIPRRVSHKYNAALDRFRHRGASLFELMVIASLVSICYIGILSQLRYYRTQYEEAEISWTVAAIQTALTGIYVRSHLMQSAAPELNGVNPFGLLMRQPTNYAGEICNADPRDLKRGNWYFDKCNSWLLYVFASEKFFAPEYPKILKFKVESFRLLTAPRKPS